MGFFYIYYVEGLFKAFEKGVHRVHHNLRQLIIWNNMVIFGLSFRIQALHSEVGYLKVIIDPDKKLFTVWVTNGEKEDDKFLEKARKDASIFKKAGYLVAFFHSGNEELLEAASALVCSNYRELCEKERQIGAAIEV